MPSTRGDSAPKPTQHRNDGRNPTLPIIICIALIGAIVFLGVLWFRHREGATSAPQSTPRPSALPPPAMPVCSDLTQMAPRDKLAQLLMVGVKGAEDARS